MASTGSHLRELRERHGVSLEEVARVTRIGQRFLEALEADDFDTVPAGPFAKGFIRSYCQALNEPSDDALSLYAAARPSGPPRVESVVPQARARGRRSLAPLFVSAALLVILGGALAAVTVALRSGRGEVASPRGEPAPAAAVRAVPQAPSPAPASRLEPRRSEPAPQASPPAPLAAAAPAPAAESRLPAGPAAHERRPSVPVATGGPYRLVARASDPTWIRVRMEGGRTTEETIPAGEIREWISNRPFELRIGNAGGIVLELNGQVLPPLGARGAVITRLVLPAEAQ
jgi:cytoskeleton protein RodZ